MENEKLNQILEEARLAYAKGFAHGLNLITQASDAPELIKEDVADTEFSVLKHDMVGVFRQQERDGLNEDIYNALELQTDGGRLSVSQRDEISLAGAKDLKFEARFWELGRYLATGKERDAYFVYMNSKPVWYNPEEFGDKDFAVVLAYAEKYGLEDGERWS